MQWIIDNWGAIAAVATVTVVNLLAIGAAVAKLTPTTSDDEWIAKVQDVVSKVVNK